MNTQQKRDILTAAISSLLSAEAGLRELAREQNVRDPIVKHNNTTGADFRRFRYQLEGPEGRQGYRCRAVAKDLASGDVLEGEWITWDMVVGEKWLDKPGSKWKTMPGQMIRYRAASFWVRTYAPEISLGMRSADESEDIDAVAEPSGGARALNDALGLSPKPATAKVAVDDDLALDRELAHEDKKR